MTKILQQIILLSLLLLLAAPFAFAASLDEYRQKIKDVAESVSYLNYPEEYLTDAENLADERGILKEIRSKLPQTEKIDLKDTSFEVSHELILGKLTEYENQAVDSTSRTPIINELSEHLAAIEYKLGELQKQENLSRTKDEEKQKLDEILKRAEFQPPVEAEETWFQRKWREFVEWLRSLFPERPKVAQPESQLQGSPMLAQGLLYLVIAAALALVGFLIYRYSPFFIRKFRERDKRDKASRVILGETLSEDDTSHNIFAEAEKLACEGNLRGAIRKGYIALLCELSDRKVIGLARHKTNRDYLRDIKKRRELHQDMSSLTLNFERNWYGFDQTEQTDWEDFKQIYQEAISKA